MATTTPSTSTTSEAGPGATQEDTMKPQKLFKLPRELRQNLLFHTFSFTATPFKAYYRIDVIDELIDRLHAMHAWSTDLRCVHSLLNTDIDFVVKQWEKQYHTLLDEFTNALTGSDSCWLSKFEAAPSLSFEAVIEVAAWAVRVPVFGWDTSSGQGRYCVYESSLARWKEAGWTKGTRLRTMRQVQRRRGGTVSLPSQNVYLFRVRGEGGHFVRVLRGGNGEEVGGEEVEECSPVRSTVKSRSTGLSRLIGKAGGVFRSK
ncbi:hypothetical protein BLS_008434 [Venturia inaequalis]|uniref:Uncharacterized protein n=1 Tax=Venturia inaequalis TaxID=5025 RepID=A0A8H3Z363_VENIN|nr:hypothetical protein BLS_008434 [Venturia inaequalis]KAE9984115.1 hypothetical protein EG328_009166 [Venturia inaequalis]KAE9991710.1 hypothetical protein EG327_011170 [Venturia inaequalis]